MVEFTVKTVLLHLISLFLMMSAGYIMGKLKLINENVSKGLSVLITKLIMPCMILYGLQQPFSQKLLGQMGLVLAAMAISVIAGIIPSFFAAKFFKVSPRERGAWLCCAGFANSVFMGKPIIIGLYGQSAEFPVAAIMFAFNLLVSTVGMGLIGSGEENGKVNIPKSALKIIKTPLVVAGIIGFVLFAFSIKLPTPIGNALSMTSATVTPLSMIVTGFSLSQIKVRALFDDYRVYILSFCRLILCPLITLFIARLFVADKTLLGIIVIAVSMPVAVIVGVMSEEKGNNPQLCSKTIFVSTILSLLTTPIIAAVLAAVS